MKKFFSPFFFLMLFLSSCLPSMRLNASSPSTLQKIGHTISSLFSYKNQERAISAYKTADFLIALSLLSSIASQKATPLKELPEEIETIVKKMGMKKENVGF